MVRSGELTVYVVDTNLLVYAANPDTEQHRDARGALEGWRRGAEPGFLTWPIIFEFLRVTTHSRLFEKPLSLPQAWSFIAAVLSSPSIGVLVPTNRHALILSELIEKYPSLRGSVLHDFHTLVLMREHGLTEIRTADDDFRRFAEVRVVNPLA